MEANVCPFIHNNSWGGSGIVLELLNLQKYCCGTEYEYLRVIMLPQQFYSPLFVDYSMIQHAVVVL
ncbi:MAG TPA: hypothetical protein VHP36_05690 [Chitinispirillaceae bacterium]|nr:hypothetical protein [Chitinispirillaceae bacterium]